MIKAIILDLDGTVYHGKTAIDGAADFVRKMEDSGKRCLFVTNRANRRPETIQSQLFEMGIRCSTNNILTAAQATAKYLKKGTAYYIGEEGLSTALEEAGIRFSDKKPDYVIVSFDRQFTYDKLKKACDLITAGAKFIATNPDKRLPFGDSINPGTGALIAAVEAGCGVKPLIVGKPERLIFDMAVKHLKLPRNEIIAVGDNIETDIAAGINAGIRTALILTGVTKRDDAASYPVKPTWIVKDFKELTDTVLHR